MKLSRISRNLDDNKNALKCLNCNLKFLSESVLHKHLISFHIQQPYIQLKRHPTNPPLKITLKSSNCGNFEIVSNSPPVVEKEEKPPKNAAEIIIEKSFLETAKSPTKTDKIIENCGSQIIIGVPEETLQKIPTPPPEGDTNNIKNTAQQQNAEYPKIKIKTSGLFKEPSSPSNNTTNKIMDNNHHQLATTSSSSKWITKNTDYQKAIIIDNNDKKPSDSLLMYEAAVKDNNMDNTNEFISLETYHEQNKQKKANKTSTSENSVSSAAATATAAPVQALTEQVARINSAPAAAAAKEPKIQHSSSSHNNQQYQTPPPRYSHEIYPPPQRFYSAPINQQRHYYPYPPTSFSARFSSHFRSSQHTPPSSATEITNQSGGCLQQNINKNLIKAPRGRPPGSSTNLSGSGSGSRIKKSVPPTQSSINNNTNNNNQELIIKPKIKRERGDRNNGAIIKKRKIDVLTPSDKDDDDCQVVCMQPKNVILGLQIENVQGGFAALDSSIVKLPESISLSVCKSTNNNKEIKKVPAESTSASASAATTVENLATVLAGRKGITVTASNITATSAATNNINNKDQIISSSNTNNNNNNNNDPVRGFNLNGVSIISKNKVKKAVPNNEISSSSSSAATTTTTSAIVDLTKDSSEISITKKSKKNPKKVNEFGIPLIDLKHPRLKQRLHRLGITQFIPLGNFTKNSHGNFALPVFNTASKNVLSNLGITQMLSLGTVKTIP